MCFSLSVLLLVGTVVQTAALETPRHDAPKDFTISCDFLPVRANVMNDAKLTCHVVPPEDVSNQTVMWSLKGLVDSKVVHAWRQGQEEPTFQNQQFKNRTRLLEEELKKGIISLLITDISLKDEGRYMCIVTIDENGTFHRPKKIGDVILLVTTEDPEDKRRAPTTTETPRPDAPEGSSVSTTGAVFIGLLSFAVGFLTGCCLKTQRHHLPKCCAEGSPKEAPQSTVNQPLMAPPAGGESTTRRPSDASSGSGPGAADPDFQPEEVPMQQLEQQAEPNDDLLDENEPLQDNEGEQHYPENNDGTCAIPEQ